MARNKSKSKKKEQHPTLFVLEGTILYFEDGSMLDLHTKVATNEWAQIVEETIKYLVFVECLKSTGMPLLQERWTEEDDYFRVQLYVAVSRMRNIDPLLVASHDQADLTKNYKEQMESGAIEVNEVVTKVRTARKQALQDKLDNDGTAVSDL